MSQHSINSVLDIDRLLDRNFGTVRITRNGKVLSFEVQSLHDSEIHEINLMCKSPEPPKKREMRVDDRGKPMIDLKTKSQIYDMVIDDSDPAFLEKCRELDRKKNLMMVVRGLRLDWSDMKDEDKVRYVSEKFSSSELLEFISSILELGVVDQEVLDAAKKESGPSEKETDGSVEPTS